MGVVEESSKEDSAIRSNNNNISSVEPSQSITSGGLAVSLFGSATNSTAPHWFTPLHYAHYYNSRLQTIPTSSKTILTAQDSLTDCLLSRFMVMSFKPSTLRLLSYLQVETVGDFLRVNHVSLAHKIVSISSDEYRCANLGVALELCRKPVKSVEALVWLWLLKLRGVLKKYGIYEKLLTEALEKNIHTGNNNLAPTLLVDKTDDKCKAFTFGTNKESNLVAPFIDIESIVSLPSWVCVMLREYFCIHNMLDLSMVNHHSLAMELVENVDNIYDVVGSEVLENFLHTLVKRPMQSIEATVYSWVLKSSKFLKLRGVGTEMLRELVGPVDSYYAGDSLPSLLFNTKKSKKRKRQDRITAEVINVSARLSSICKLNVYRASTLRLLSYLQVETVGDFLRVNHVSLAHKIVSISSDEYRCANLGIPWNKLEELLLCRRPVKSVEALVWLWLLKLRGVLKKYGIYEKLLTEALEKNIHTGNNNLAPTLLVDKTDDKCKAFTFGTNKESNLVAPFIDIESIVSLPSWVCVMLREYFCIHNMLDLSMVNHHSLAMELVENVDNIYDVVGSEVLENFLHTLVKRPMQSIEATVYSWVSKSLKLLLPFGFTTAFLRELVGPVDSYYAGDSLPSLLFNTKKSKKRKRKEENSSAKSIEMSIRRSEDTEKKLVLNNSAVQFRNPTKGSMMVNTHAVLHMPVTSLSFIPLWFSIFLTKHCGLQSSLHFITADPFTLAMYLSCQFKTRQMENFHYNDPSMYFFLRMPVEKITATIQMWAQEVRALISGLSYFKSSSHGQQTNLQFKPYGQHWIAPVHPIQQLPNGFNSIESRSSTRNTGKMDVTQTDSYGEFFNKPQLMNKGPVAGRKETGGQDGEGPVSDEGRVVSLSPLNILPKESILSISHSGPSEKSYATEQVRNINNVQEAVVSSSNSVESMERDLSERNSQYQHPSADAVDYDSARVCDKRHLSEGYRLPYKKVKIKIGSYSYVLVEKCSGSNESFGPCGRPIISESSVTSSDILSHKRCCSNVKLSEILALCSKTYAYIRRKHTIYTAIADYCKIHDPVMRFLKCCDEGEKGKYFVEMTEKEARQRIISGLRCANAKKQNPTSSITQDYYSFNESPCYEILFPGKKPSNYCVTYESTSTKNSHPDLETEEDAVWDTSIDVSEDRIPQRRKVIERSIKQRKSDLPADEAHDTYKKESQNRKDGIIYVGGCYQKSEAKQSKKSICIKNQYRKKNEIDGVVDSVTMNKYYCHLVPWSNEEVSAMLNFFSHKPQNWAWISETLKKMGYDRSYVSIKMKWLQINGHCSITT